MDARPNRRLDGSPERGCLAEREKTEGKDMSKTENGRLCVGVDLHKTQFTVCAMNEEGEYLLERKYPTTEEGYEAFSQEMHRQEEQGYSIELAVETTGNARYFKNRMEKEYFSVKVVNTNRFKVITMSTKKTDANDAATLAYYLMKEMLPEANLCSQTSEEIRRMLKTRTILVQSMVKIKNQIHGMMLGCGIETKAAQFQSKKKRQELMNDLADHEYSAFTASSLKVMLQIIDDLSEEIKRVEAQLVEGTADEHPRGRNQYGDHNRCLHGEPGKVRWKLQTVCVLHWDRTQRPQFQRNKASGKDHEAWPSGVAHSVCPGCPRHGSPHQSNF